MVPLDRATNLDVTQIMSHDTLIDLNGTEQSLSDESSNDARGADHAPRTGSGLPSSAGRRVFAPLLLCHAGCTSLKRFKGLGGGERERWKERGGGGGGGWPRMRE